MTDLMRLHDRRTLRVWERHPRTGGLVRLALRPNEPVSVGGASRDEEGYESWGGTWEWDPSEGAHGVIRYRYGYRGCDCDGRYASGGDWVCPIGASGYYDYSLQWEDDDKRGPVLPVARWTSAGQWQRDMAAEAAGY